MKMLLTSAASNIIDLQLNTSNSVFIRPSVLWDREAERDRDVDKTTRRLGEAVKKITILYSSLLIDGHEMSLVKVFLPFSLFTPAQTTIGLSSFGTADPCC
jgi:hypothetical protein